MSEINSTKISLQETMLPDLIQKVEYLNLSCKAKAPARFNIRLSNVIDNPIYYVSKAGTSVSLEGYQSPSTGLFITNDTLNDTVVAETAKAARENKVYKGETSAIGCLYRELFFDMHKRISNYVSQLRKKQEKDPKAYDGIYKDPDVIAAELIDYLNNTSKFMTNVYSELRSLPLHDVPVLNSKLSYIDDDHTDVGVTDLVPFANPERQALTQEQKELVEHFLSVFFDEDNLSVFSWMMGAVFMNAPIHAENISRFFLLYSSEGGVGKSTVMKLITEGLLPSSFAILLPEFDTYFLSGDRFRSSNLSQKRLVVYDEAIFNAPTDRENNHDFHGINEDVIKTFATNGRLLLEKKFQAPKLAHFDNIHVILTNFLPVVPITRKDLGRRFLPCMLKPTTMQEKARELSGMTTQQMIEYVHKHGQAFINYFAKTYSDDPYKYTNFVYHHDDTESEERTSVERNAKAVDAYHEKLKSLGVFEMLKTLGSDLNADAASLIADCKKAIPSDDYIQNSKRKFVTYTNPDNKDIHVGVNTQTNEMFIYLNRSKRLFTNYRNGLAIREELFAIAEQKKKFTQDVFELPLTIDKHTRKITCNKTSAGASLSNGMTSNSAPTDQCMDISGDVIPELHVTSDHEAATIGNTIRSNTDSKPISNDNIDSKSINNKKSDNKADTNLLVSRRNKNADDTDISSPNDRTIQLVDDNEPSKESDKDNSSEHNVTTHQLHKLDNISKDTIAISDVQAKGIVDVFDIIQKRTTVDVSHVLTDIKRYSPTMRVLKATPVCANKNNDTFIYVKDGNVVNIYVDIEKLQKRYGYSIYQALNAFSEKTTFNDEYCFKYHI